MGIFAQQVQPMKFSFKKHTIVLFACAIISLEVRCFTGDFSKQKIQDRTNVPHDQNTPIAQAVSIWNEETRKRSERGWVATQWAQNAACSSSDEHQKVKKKKAWSPHLTLEELRSDGHPATVRGQLPDKKPCVNYQGRFLLQKRGWSHWKHRASHLKALHVWRYCSWWISEPSQLYFRISEAAHPPRLWMQAGRECPWISLETCPTDRTQDRRHTDKRLPSILQQRAEC